MHPESSKLPVLHLLPLCCTRQLLTAPVCGVLHRVCPQRHVFSPVQDRVSDHKVHRRNDLVTRVPFVGRCSKGTSPPWEAELRSSEGGWKGFVVLVVGLCLSSGGWFSVSRMDDPSNLGNILF